MFTGLIYEVGTVECVISTDAGLELRVSCSYSDLVAGESIAVNGACLTVRSCEAGSFTTAAVETTLGRTTIGEWREGKRVNLERALTFGDKLGGHIVQGHVDCVATVTDVSQAADARLIDISLPACSGVSELVVQHGSIAMDGVSLTVNEVSAGDTVQVALIEYTLRHTTLGMLATGDRVHVETDMIGKYVQRAAAAYFSASSR